MPADEVERGVHRCEDRRVARRVRLVRWGPRTLDVDVLLYGDQRIDTPDLTVPHPRMTERNFNPLMATAATLVIAEVEEIVPEGTIPPDQVHTPGIYVQRIFQGSGYEKPIEQRTVRPRP